jgi:hypothetical protein
MLAGPRRLRWRSRQSESRRRAALRVRGLLDDNPVGGHTLAMRCAYCHLPLGYVHGHAACLKSDCAMFGVNQAECCAGEVGGCLPTFEPGRGR